MIKTVIQNNIRETSQMNKINTYTAVIIEVTKHPALYFVLQNFLDNLSDEWTFVIFHGNNNEEYVKNILNEKLRNYISRIKLVKLNVSVSPRHNNMNNNYDYVWKNSGIYDYIQTETFLVFKTDSIILKENKHILDYFLKYDYVGAPWRDEVVGNGGLSLRRKSKMLKIINKYDAGDKNEDEFFSRQNGVSLNRPSFEDATKFSVETVFYESPFGIHNCYNKNYLTEDNLNFLMDKYPIIKELKEIKQNDNLSSLSCKKFTLVYKTYRNDLEWLRYSLLSLQKFLKTENIFEIIIYTHDVVYGDVHRLLDDIEMTYFMNYRIIPVQYNYHGYVKQMVVKSNCYKDCKTEYVILLDSDLILKKKLNVESFIKQNGKIEWFYLEKENDPKNDVFTVWKKAVEDSTRVPQTIHYMSNGFPFIFTRKSLEDAANKFIEINGCDYEKYCGDRCYYEGINVSDRITTIFNKLSRIWTEFEYLGFYCHKYSADYIFTPTKHCRMKNQFRNSNTDAFFVQYWSHESLDDSLKNKINLNNRRQKTVVHVFTQSVTNLKTDNVNNFWGLGDIIRGTIALFQLSKKHDFRLIVDIQLHPISKYFKYNTHEYSEYIQKNKDNIPFIYPDTLEKYIEQSNDTVLFLLTNDNFHNEITNECKNFIKELLTPNLEFEQFIQDVIKTKPTPENYSILHFRLGDSFLVRNEQNNQLEEVRKKMYGNVESTDILMSDSNCFKEFIMSNNPDIFLYHIHASHMGLQMHAKYIKDTLFEFILITRSNKIKTYSTYGHLSGFVKIAHDIYDVPLSRIN